MITDKISLLKETIAKEVFIKNNAASLIYSASANVVIGCFIDHIGAFFTGNIINENIFNGSYTSTPTYTIFHFNSHLCLTPEGLGGLDIPCPTSPLAPSTCIFPSDHQAESMIGYTTLIHLIMSSLYSLII